MTPEEACSRAINAIGGPAAVGKLFTEPPLLTSQAVSQWKVIPPARVLRVVQAARAAGLGLSVHDMRPDIYGTSDQVAA